MAKLSITEYARVTRDGNNRPVMVAHEPGTDQEVTFTTATQSAAFASTTTMVRLVADAACRVKFGSNPTATASSQRLIADTEYWRGVEPGDKVSVYDGTS